MQDEVHQALVAFLPDEPDEGLCRQGRAHLERGQAVLCEEIIEFLQSFKISARYTLVHGPWTNGRTDRLWGRELLCNFDQV